jgi:hypothetical protein
MEAQDPQTPFDTFTAIPVGSLTLIDDINRDQYIAQFYKLPASTIAMTSSPQTGAYLRGLVKVYSLPLENSSMLAWSVLRVAVGEITLAQLPSVISTELKVANDKAQAIATDIEKELFAPIMLEYNQSLRSSKAAASPSLQPSAGAQNVLDLKQQVANRPLQAPPASRPIVTAPRPAAPLRPTPPSPAPSPRPPMPKSVFPPTPPLSSSRPPNVPW